MCDGRREIKCILLSEFHHTVGPKIVYQIPEDFISKEEFDAVHIYIITKHELEQCIITISAFGKKIVGCPVYIDSKDYARNALIFNLCFVFDTSTNTVPYEIVVKKLASYLTTLELESKFLSDEGCKRRLPSILQQIRDELNIKGTCCIPMNESTAIHLKVAPLHKDPLPVQGHDVPIISISHRHIHTKHWDLATQQLLAYIDGFKHVARIAAEADVDINIVKACMQNLVYHGAVKLISVFQYSNVYVVTPDINKLADNAQLQRECLDYVARPGKHPRFGDVFTLYCSMCAGATIRDLCVRFHPHNLAIDERKLIHYGLMLGIIRRILKYPVKLPNELGCSKLPELYRWYNGRHSYDEICCCTGLSYQELDEKVESDPGIVVCWK